MQLIGPLMAKADIKTTARTTKPD